VDVILQMPLIDLDVGNVHSQAQRLLVLDNGNDRTLHLGGLHHFLGSGLRIVFEVLEFTLARGQLGRAGRLLGVFFGRLVFLSFILVGVFLCRLVLLDVGLFNVILRWIGLLFFVIAAQDRQAQQETHQDKRDDA